jgi:hypothetical protein
LQESGRSKYIFFLLAVFFYQKFDQKASNICVVFSLCTLQVVHDYQHTGATRANFCQAAGGGNTCGLFVSVGISSRGPGAFASANRELYKAAGRSKIYIYIKYFFFVAFCIPRVQRSPTIGVHYFASSKANPAFLLWLMMTRLKSKEVV